MPHKAIYSYIYETTNALPPFGYRLHLHTTITPAGISAEFAKEFDKESRLQESLYAPNAWIIHHRRSKLASFRPPFVTPIYNSACCIFAPLQKSYTAIFKSCHKMQLEGDVNYAMCAIFLCTCCMEFENTGDTYTIFVFSISSEDVKQLLLRKCIFVKPRLHYTRPIL